MQSENVTVFENSIGYYSFCYPTDKSIEVKLEDLEKVSSKDKRLNHIAYKGHEPYLLNFDDGSAKQIVWRKI